MRGTGFVRVIEKVMKPLAAIARRQGIDRPFSWMIAEAFRVERGLLTRIEALMTEVPYGHRSGWAAG